VEFQRRWVLKSKIFGQEYWPRILAKNIPNEKKILRGMSIHQKLGMLLKSKVVQKLSLEEMLLPKNGLLN
jgi:hypothetical protein